MEIMVSGPPRSRSLSSQREDVSSLRRTKESRMLDLPASFFPIRTVSSGSNSTLMSFRLLNPFTSRRLTFNQRFRASPQLIFLKQSFQYHVKFVISNGFQIRVPSQNSSYLLSKGLPLILVIGIMLESVRTYSGVIRLKSCP